MDIAITGSIAYDYIMQFPGRFADQIVPDKIDHISLSFLVDKMTKHWGGVAANIAYTLALLQQKPAPRLVGTVGRDFGDYRAWLEQVGVDTSAVRQIDDVFTASFFVNTDIDNNQIASFYAGAMAYARDFSLAELLSGRPDLVVISPNDPVAMERYVDECHATGIPFMYDPSQQVARFNGEQLWHGIERAQILVCNEYEFDLIQQKTGKSADQIINRVPVVIITLGEKGARIFTDGNTIDVPVFPVETIADPTGVGDAFRSGLLRGMAEGWDWLLCGQMGALCAAYVLEQVGTQSHRFTLPEFIARFRTVFDDHGQLDTLLG
ncbi:MAG: carbohydrate kinase family protein [Anaerolineae bacterium]